MARMPYAERARMSEDTAKTFDKLAPLNIFRMMAHSGPVLQGFLRLGNAILYKGKLDPILREMAIVRTGILCKSSYEVHQHDRISLDLGMSADKLQALRIGPEAPIFSPLEKLVLRYTDEVTLQVRAGDALFAALLAELGEEQMIELTMAIGFYGLVSRFLENTAVEIEAERVGPPLTLPRK